MYLPIFPICEEYFSRASNGWGVTTSQTPPHHRRDRVLKSRRHNQFTKTPTLTTIHYRLLDTSRWGIITESSPSKSYIVVLVFWANMNCVAQYEWNRALLRNEPKTFLLLITSSSRGSSAWSRWSDMEIHSPYSSLLHAHLHSKKQMNNKWMND